MDVKFFIRFFLIVFVKHKFWHLKKCEYGGQIGAGKIFL